MGRAVSVLTEVAAVGRVFDYATSERTGALAVGDRVRVNLHGRSVRGWVVGPGTDRDDLKPVAKVLGLGPPPELVDLSSWAARRWAGPRARFLLAASPRTVVHALPDPPSRGVPPRALDGAVAYRPGVIELGPATDPLGLVLHAYATTAGPGSLLVLVPTEAWAHRLARRLEGRGVPVALADQWDRARAGWPVVVGSRGAAWSPVPVVAGAVVIDADDERFRSEAAPTWEAGAVLRERCRRAGAPWWATSPLASPTLRAAGTRQTPRDASAAWPAIVVADRRRLDPRSGALSEPALSAARSALAGPEAVAVVILSQRLGAGRLLACRQCGELARCAVCGQAEREEGDRLSCADSHDPRTRFCRACGSTSLRAVRAGVTTLARDVADQLAQPVSELTARSEDAVLARVVVGTEAALTRVRRAGTFVFADFDQYLLAPRARARRDAVLAVARAGRIVGGRADARGVVVLQTRRAEDVVIEALRQGDLHAVAAADDEDARALGLAPYGAVATLRGPGAAPYAAALARGDVVAHEGEGCVVLTAPSVAALTDRLAAVARPAEVVHVSVD